METILEGSAQFYKHTLGAETRKGMAQLTRNGLWRGGKAPFGYRVIEEPATATARAHKCCGGPRATWGLGSPRTGSCWAATGRGARRSLGKPANLLIMGPVTGSRRLLIRAEDEGVAEARLLGLVVCNRLLELSQRGRLKLLRAWAGGLPSWDESGPVLGEVAIQVLIEESGSGRQPREILRPSGEEPVLHREVT